MHRPYLKVSSDQTFQYTPCKYFGKYVQMKISEFSSLLLLSLVELQDFKCDFNNCFGLLYMCCILPGKYNGQCQFGCGILKIVGPKQQNFCPKINMLKVNFDTNYFEPLMILSSQQKLEFLKLIVLFLHYFWRQKAQIEWKKHPYLLFLLLVLK